ncbi:MAG: M28 family peptidase [Polyangiaceae bacterium]
MNAFLPRPSRRFPLLLATSSLAVLAACGPSEAPAPKTAAVPAATAAKVESNPTKPYPSVAEEVHLADVRQLTFGGENAEAYWSFGGDQLILQARKGDAECDRIYRMPIAKDSVSFLPVSNGKGATTCSYFLPGDKDVIYASTQLGGDACPPKPDHALGYVWALYDTYDIFRASADGSNVTRLTDTKGYDAEATVCKKDGSIVFTSTRDGDIELYRMDSDGKNVKRLTHTPGYDGGAFFNEDCSKIVWRASRPKGKDLEDFKGLLAKGLVRPSKLEIMVANSDGSEATQITYLDAASFAPYWHPNQKRILFSTNYGDPKGREFDIWAVDIDGSHLERITSNPGFDGFPMFSPDGKTLAFASNRATEKGKHDTNVFLARWVESEPKVTEQAADRVAKDVAWLADDAREGRGIGTKGLDESGAWIEKRFQDLGLEPAGGKKSFRQAFPVVTALAAGAKSKLVLDGKTTAKDAFVPMAFSAKGKFAGSMALAGYGIAAKEIEVDDFAGVDVKGKIAVVRRFVPDGAKFAKPEAQRRYGDVRKKAWNAREKGAKALLVVDMPLPPENAPAEWKVPNEAPLPALVPDGYADAGIPVMVAKREAMAGILAKLEAKTPVKAELEVALEETKTDAFNVVGRLRASGPKEKRLPGVVVVGAHYDHLGMGGHHSLAPDKKEPHNGADDNASGTAVLLEVARTLASREELLARDVLFVAFSGEEAGVLGSSFFARTPPPGVAMKDVVAMVNMDMVGRMRENKVDVLGADSATEWKGIVDEACTRARVVCAPGGDGYGPSDQTPFYAANVPVLHFFTGAHGDYHKPTDDAAKQNAAGEARIALVVADTLRAVAKREGKLTYKSVPSPTPRGDLRSFNASLGTIPDYAGPPGKKGVLLSGVRPGSAAEKSGMKRGDVLVRIGTHEIGSVEDLMYVLNASKPGETVGVVVQRDGKDVKLEATFGESSGRR